MRHWTIILPVSVLILTTLKLFGVIGWSWWWVVSPVLLPFAVTFVGYFVAVFTLKFIERYEKRTDK